MLERRFNEVDEIRTAFEQAVRVEAWREADPAAFLRRMQPELMNVLLGAHASDIDHVTQLRVRATLAVVVADVLPRLIAEHGNA